MKIDRKKDRIINNDTAHQEIVNNIVNYSFYVYCLFYNFFTFFYI